MGMADYAGYGMAFAGSYSKYKQDAVQAEMNEAVRLENNRRAAVSLASTYRSLESEQGQIQEDAIAFSIDAQKAAAQARGAVQAQAGAEGITGGAIEMSMRDVDVEHARSVSRATMNRERELAQLTTATRDAEQAYSSRLQLMPTQKPSAFSYAADGLITGFGVSQSIKDLMKAEKEAKRAKV